MPTVKDQTGYEIQVDEPAKRIISLVPSQTELLIDLIGTEKVVGRTKFCIHPRNEISKIPIVGGTKKFDFSKIDELKPDLIIANKEENYKEGVEILRKKFPVWTSDIFNLKDNYEMITAVGNLIGEKERANQLVKETQASFEKVQKTKKGSVLYFIWQKPYMVAGKSTFVDSLLTYLGYNNKCIQMRYPEMDQYILDKLDPDFIFLSSEPFPFKEKHVVSFQEMFPNSEVILVDGEMFSWYGSRLLKAGSYFLNSLPS